jgi:hypothetical protein
MDTIRLFIRTNSVRNSRIKIDTNSKTDSNSNSINETQIDEFSNEKLSRDNIKSFLSSHPSSTSLSSRSPLNSSKIGRSSTLSNSSLINTNIVANASATISNAHSFTNDHYYNKYTKRKQRRHSWTGEDYIHHISSTRRTKSFPNTDQRRRNSIKYKYSTDKMKQKIVEGNRSTKSVSFPFPTNINNQLFSIASIQRKTIPTNAFLTAASIFKYWVLVFFLPIIRKIY